METESEDLSRLRDAAKQPPLNRLVGKFHAHLSFNLGDEQIEACRHWCRQHRAKLTVIDLENSSGKSQTDVMLTAHFRDQEVDAVARITDRLLELRRLAEAECFSVTRLKLEHESLPSLPTFDEHHYHEVHIKLEIPAKTYSSDYQRLLALGDRLGFVPSRNPYQRSDSMVTQFANLRIYKGDHDAAESRVAAMVNDLKAAGFVISDVKRETVVYDTAHGLDAWWA